MSLLFRRKRLPADDRDRLLAMLPPRSRGAEIGVWRGDFSAKILDRVRPVELHLIDPWRFEVDARYADAWYGGADARDQSDMDAIHDGVQRRFTRSIRRGTVVVHRATSESAAGQFADGSLDWVYIDGNHLYEFVAKDLALFWPKLRPGGLLTGDDYTEGQWWQGGVMRAVDGFVQRHHVEGAEIIGSQFALTKPHDAAISC